jgi:tetrahydromethanopterin S-methyltransferase subunit B
VKGNAFLGNVVYGLWTGAIAGAVVAIIYFAVLAARSRQ